MADVQHNGSGRPPVDQAESRTPRPVPELQTDEGLSDLAEAGPRPQQQESVTDEDRNRFGVLLDHAAERGLLGPADYQARLRELAEATSIHEMTQIVSELPAFTAGPPVAGRSRAAPGLAVLGTWEPTVPRRKAPWVMLVIVFVTVVLALVVLAVFAAHTVHDRTGSSQPAPVTVSVPRL